VSSHRGHGAAVQLQLHDRRDVADADADVLPRLPGDEVRDLVDVELGLVQDVEPTEELRRREAVDVAFTEDLRLDGADDLQTAHRVGLPALSRSLAGDGHADVLDGPGRDVVVVRLGDEHALCTQVLAVQQLLQLDEVRLQDRVDGEVGALAESAPSPLTTDEMTHRARVDGDGVQLGRRRCRWRPAASPGQPPRRR
jgi:hypothetical protein